MPGLPYPMYGYLPNNGVNVPVTQKNLSTNEEETIISAADGSFLLDPSSLPSGTNEELGDIIRITSGNYYTEIIIDRVTFPDGREVVLTNNPITMATVIPSGVMGKFPHMDDRVMAFPGGVSVGRGGMG